MTTDPTTHATAGVDPAAVSAPSWRVLVVDVEPMIQRLLVTQLTPHRFEVATAGSVARAVGECRQHSFDLILLDIELQCGAHLLEQIVPAVPIAYLSADVTHEQWLERLSSTGVVLPKFQPTDKAVSRLSSLCELVVGPPDGVLIGVRVKTRSEAVSHSIESFHAH